MRIAVIGSGIVGQATGLGLAKHRHGIVFVDSDAATVNSLREQGHEAHEADTYQKIDTDITMLAIPAGDQDKDTRLLIEAVRAFAHRLKQHKKYHLLVIRSTVTPTTTRAVLIPTIEKISGKQAGRDFGVAVQPEYLRAGMVEQDFDRPWLILIGQLDKKSGDTLQKLFRYFDAPVVRVSIEEAEFQKYVHDAFNETKVAFFEEMRAVARQQDWNADVIFLATAESAEGIWNPLYGLHEKRSHENPTSAPHTTTSAFINWAHHHGYKLPLVESILANRRPELAPKHMETARRRK